MAQERLKSPRARLFIALDLPDSVRDAIDEWGARELTDPALRPVACESLHITLCFLGWTAEKRIPELADAIAAIDPRPVPVRLEAMPVAKPPRRPALFALEADSDAAVKLQEDVSRTFEALGAYRPEKRPFWPHVTVARVRPERATGGGRRRRGKPQRVERPPGELPQEIVHTFDSIRVSLYRSNLRPEGAQYVSLASSDLPPGPPPEPGETRGDEEDG